MFPFYPPDVLEEFCVPHFCVTLAVGYEGEDDVLDDLEHVGLDQLPRVGVRDGRVDVVDGLLHHPRGHVGLLPVLVKALQHGREDALRGEIHCVKLKKYN